MLTALFLILSAPSPVDPDCPLVRLEDAHRFPILPAACRHYWACASRHANDLREVVCGGWNNDPAACQEWEAECAWRARCWYYLDDVLYCDYPPERKLRSLDQLRRLIGDEAYFTGQMPDPTPRYKFPTR